MTRFPLTCYASVVREVPGDGGPVLGAAYFSISDGNFDFYSASLLLPSAFGGSGCMFLCRFP